MPRPKYVKLGDQRYLWKDVLTAYREQAKVASRPEQPMLFENLHEDRRGPGERSAAERYLSPTLFDSLKS
jgi:hypothetical protein